MASFGTPESGLAAGRGKKLRYAVLGQGYISQAAVLPAFQHASENSELVALVSDNAKKLEELSARYRVATTCGYSGYADLLASGKVDAVYIALPNSMHRDFAVRAAQAGVHVLCEKPMALTEEDCRAMIEAARYRGVKLMVAYRLHFERTNLEAIDIMRSGRIGETRFFEATCSMQVQDDQNIRLRKDLGGGALWNIGIDCINAARYLFRDEPTEVFATTMSKGEGRFREVEEMASAILTFPGHRLATFTCSFGAADVSSYRLVGTDGELRVEPAFGFAEGLSYHLTVRGKTTERSFRRSDQFAAELIHFSESVLAGEEPQPSGREGQADVRVIEALHRSALERRPLKLPAFEQEARPGPEQVIERPATREPKLVLAQAPSRR